MAGCRTNDLTLQLVLQFLRESEYGTSFDALQNESGVAFDDKKVVKTGQLQAIVDEHNERNRERCEIGASLDELFERGDGSYVKNILWSLDSLDPGSSMLAVRLTKQGVLTVGTNRGDVLLGEIPLPLPQEKPYIIPFHVSNHRGGVLGLDFHPTKKNLLLTCGMDRSVCLVDASPDGTEELLQKFTDHQKYVVRVCWAPSGKYFVSASYDKTVLIYRGDETCSSFTQIDQQFFKGAIEGLTFFKTKDIFIVSVRDDCHLHLYELTEGGSGTTKLDSLNMNALGDDFVSFTALDVSTNPTDKYILVSTDRNRLVLFDVESKRQLANFYGTKNDEFSQPRHCWHRNSQYIYATSQDKIVCVWEVSTQRIVARLEGHQARVRDLHYCADLNALVSCSFDGTVRVWSTQAGTSPE
ncbi:uncharacterized protein [Oscarella lobularis]|uniref:uncharacterized protein n=1 Tax=Oscarella lobularis TaxID=121494 RepID=UPI003313A2CB